jgi:CheY-like chemotaxis protein
MKNNLLNYCSYPTRVILIDDHPSFLNEIQLALNLHNIPSLSFLNISDFFEYMEKYSPKNFVDSCINFSDDADLDHYMVDINLGNIHQKVYDPSRFDEISIIITDYDMPKMNGITLLKKCNYKSPIKTMLLTGVADEKIAVDAFNNGLIHAFVRKDHVKFIDELTQKILYLQNLYFKDLSDLLVNESVNKANKVLTCFADPIYINFVKKIILAEQAVEYYLLDELGSFLLVDIQGNHKWLIIRDENEMQLHYELANEYKVEDSVPEEILEKLGNRSHLLFLGIQNLPPSQWLNHLYPAQHFSGEKKYYYSIVKNDSPMPSLIRSFSDYLAQAGQ